MRNRSRPAELRSTPSECRATVRPMRYPSRMPQRAIALDWLWPGRFQIRPRGQEKGARATCRALDAGQFRSQGPANGIARRIRREQGRFRTVKDIIADIEGRRFPVVWWRVRMENGEQTLLARAFSRPAYTARRGRAGQRRLRQGWPARRLCVRQDHVTAWVSSFDETRPAESASYYADGEQS